MLNEVAVIHLHWVGVLCERAELPLEVVPVQELYRLVQVAHEDVVLDDLHADRRKRRIDERTSYKAVRGCVIVEDPQRRRGCSESCQQVSVDGRYGSDWTADVPRFDLESERYFLPAGGRINVDPK
eukprot:CAMPEP_0202094898 /NCGR_PEP_ID=MMETSP0964-20121228/49273_1 /ASSEMBLY_ACC=CAM_ASM_000500 /TAXON_ID=4773 /ORGANISM="Schizochytrium aggregatum, Strain ATCC28209" /LENGTH=125 /DNA_ID=CAMNT_0048663151 /DNA_START=551 /DNA_END=925 /DNA_ORIENTATION=+